MVSVLLVAPSASLAGGGVSEAVRLTATMFAEDPEVAIRVVAMDDGPDAPVLEGWHGTPVETYRYFGPASFKFSPGLLVAVLRAREDILHVHGIWQFQCFAALAARLLRRKRYLVTPHGMLEAWIRARSVRLKMLVSRLYQDRFFAEADCFQVLTQKESGDVHAVVPQADCEVIPNFVDNTPAPTGRPSWWSPDLDGKSIFLFFGRIHEKKGCLELLDAWDDLCQRDPGFTAGATLIFCGYVDGLDEFASRMESLHDRFGNARFVGRQYDEEKLRSLASAAFLCLPSRSEGLPLAILEGWAQGVPAIMTAECNLSIGFEAGASLQTGVQPTEIAHTLQAAFGLSREQRATMSHAARQLIGSTFSPAVAGNKLKQLYLALAGRGKAT